MCRLVGSFDDDKRYEIYDGQLVLMGAPSAKHQAVLGDLFVQFRDFFKGKKCNKNRIILKCMK